MKVESDVLSDKKERIVRIYQYNNPETYIGYGIAWNLESRELTFIGIRTINMRGREHLPKCWTYG